MEEVRIQTCVTSVNSFKLLDTMEFFILAKVDHFIAQQGDYLLKKVQSLEVKEPLVFTFTIEESSIIHPVFQVSFFYRKISHRLLQEQPCLTLMVEIIVDLN
jgi:hypothetical protein